MFDIYEAKGVYINGAVKGVAFQGGRINVRVIKGREDGPRRGMQGRRRSLVLQKD